MFWGRVSIYLVIFTGEWATLDRLILVTDVVMSHASSAMTPRWKSDMLPNVLHANYLSFFILTLLDQAF